MKLKLPMQAIFLVSSLAVLTGFHSQTAATPKQIDHIDKLPVVHLDQQPDDKQTWGAIRWLMNGKIDADTAQSFGLVTINPGQKNTSHLHPNCEELFYVLSGSGDTVVADQKVTLHPGDLIRIPANTVHQTTATSTAPLVAVISYDAPAKQNINLPVK